MRIILEKYTKKEKIPKRINKENSFWVLREDEANNQSR